MADTRANTLHYGDNLDVLRESIASESVDLVYLDPPFNSNTTYNVLFRSPAGQQSEAQLEVFDDTWHWGESAARAYDDVLHGRNTDVATMLRAMRSMLGENDMFDGYSLASAAPIGIPGCKFACSPERGGARLFNADEPTDLSPICNTWP